MTPHAEISVNGRPVASVFDERLISVTITDKEGATSDTIACDLADGNPFAEIPKKGDRLTVKLGYRETGLVDFGAYTIDDPEVRCLPYGMTINGKGANVRDKSKQHRARHWDKTTLGDVVRQIASENGLTPVIDAALAAHRYEWLGQQDESDMHLLERLARRLGALHSVKAGRLVFARKGSGLSASGAALTPVVASPANIVEGSCRIQHAHRNRFKQVHARWRDTGEAKTKSVSEASDGEGEADYTLPEMHADEAEALAAAKSKAKDLKANTMRASVTLYGDAAIRAGAPFSFAGVRPGVDGVDFIIETATHSLTKSAYTTEVEAKLKP